MDSALNCFDMALFRRKRIREDDLNKYPAKRVRTAAMKPLSRFAYDAQDLKRVDSGYASSSELCSRCAVIDFDSVFLGAPTGKFGSPVLELGHISPSLLSSTCPFCRL